MPGRIGVWAGMMVLGTGLIFAVLNVAVPLFAIAPTWTWQSVSCMVEAVSVQPVDSVEAIKRYLPTVTYTYAIDGKTHTGDRFAPFWRPSARRERLENYLEPYAAGTETTCFVKRGDPGVSVLTRTYQRDAAAGGVVAGALIAIGAIIAGAGWILTFPDYDKEDKSPETLRAWERRFAPVRVLLWCGPAIGVDVLVFSMFQYNDDMNFIALLFWPTAAALLTGKALTVAWQYFVGSTKLQAS